jgi:hypothetical protein
MNYGESLIAFLGYVLPYGQMSLWGYFKLAPHVYLLISNYMPLEKCQDIFFPYFKQDYLAISIISNINCTDLEFLAKDKKN